MTRVNLRNSFGLIHLGNRIREAAGTPGLLSGLVFACALSFICGCAKKENDRWRIKVMRYCNEIVSNPAVCERTRKLAQKAVDGWRNGIVDPQPVLIHAGYGPHSTENCYALRLIISDENFDVAGFGVREVHTQPNGKVIVVEEQYPIFPGKRLRYAPMLRFKERKSLSDKKDEQAWADYAANPDRVMVYRRKKYPEIWIAIPRPPEVEVEIDVFDFGGNRSESLPLEYGTPTHGKQYKGSYD